jgi:hypothetical protein
MMGFSAAGAASFNKSLQLTRVTGRFLWQSLRAILPQKPPCNAVN